MDAPHRTELIIKRSRFITQSAHVDSLEDGRRFVERVRRAYSDANHNCWACVGAKAGDAGHAASSDDGEPSGTAGKPMLQILLHSGLGEICLVVTRYFGGIKLGTGGLVRAYQDCVRQNLESLPHTEKRVLTALSFEIDYNCLESVQRMLGEEGGEIHALSLSLIHI